MLKIVDTCLSSAVPEQLYVNSSGMNDLQLAPDYVQGMSFVFFFSFFLSFLLLLLLLLEHCDTATPSGHFHP